MSTDTKLIKNVNELDINRFSSIEEYNKYFMEEYQKSVHDIVDDSICEEFDDEVLLLGTWVYHRENQDELNKLCDRLRVFRSEFKSMYGDKFLDVKMFQKPEIVIEDEFEVNYPKFELW